MPSDTFKNLSAEKQMRIINAAREEIKRVSADQISINRIIQNANIARGSFYQYFTDKQDLLIYIMRDLLYMLRQNTLQVLEKTGGDPFAAVMNAFNTILTYAEDEDNYSLLKNIFPYFNMDLFSVSFPYLHICAQAPCTCSEELEYPIRLFTVFAEKYRISTEDFIDLLEILNALLYYAIAQTFSNSDQTDDIRNHFAVKLKHIYIGFTSEEVPCYG